MTADSRLVAGVVARVGGTCHPGPERREPNLTVIARRSDEAAHDKCAMAARVLRRSLLTRKSWPTGRKIRRNSGCFMHGCRPTGRWELAVGGLAHMTVELGSRDSGLRDSAQTLARARFPSVLSCPQAAKISCPRG